MRNFRRNIFFACGLLLTLAVVSVFAQQKVTGEIKINNKPFEDLAALVKQQVAAGKVDLTKPFSIELKGMLLKDGRLDAGKSQLVKSAGDAAIIAVGKNFIEAVSDSNALAFLQQTGVEKINFTLAQDGSKVRAAIVWEELTADKAKTISSQLNILVSLVLQMSEKAEKKLGEDEKILMSGFKASSSDKIVKLNYAYDKAFIQAFIKRKLDAAK